MFKAIKIVVLLAILVGAAAVVYTYVRSSGDETGSGPDSIGSPDAAKSGVRVEEKYGFTSGTVEDP